MERAAAKTVNMAASINAAFNGASSGSAAQIVLSAA